MAGVITGKARSTDGWRTSLSDPLIIGQKKQTGMTGGDVDLSKVTDARRVSKRTMRLREAKRVELQRQAAKRARRHAATLRRKAKAA